MYKSKDNKTAFNSEVSGGIELDDETLNKILGGTTVTLEFDYKDYKVKIGNIQSEFMIMGNRFGVSEIMIEYLTNIVKQLDREGYNFNRNDVIDFQKYLVY